MALETTELLIPFQNVMTGPVGLAFSLTLLGALALGGLRRSRDGIHGTIETAEVPAPKIPRELKIPVVQTDPDKVERLDLTSRVSHLMSENDWDRIAAEIAAWESRLDATPGGARKHEIAVDLCLAGLEALLDDAPRTTMSDLAPATAAVARFVERHRAAPLDPILAVLAAKAHMAVARTCNAEFWPDRERHAAWRVMAHHYLEAEAILAPFDPVAFMSPLLAGANYELALGMPDGGARRQPAFEDWIDLDPSNPAIYATHMPNLLGDDIEDVENVLAEAMRSDERTAETLGHGGYALALLPVLDEDPRIRARIENDRFACGLMDLARLSGTQAEVNWAAATLVREAGIGDAARRAVFQSAFDALVRRHLTVIYPRLWGEDLDAIRARLHDTFERGGEQQVSENGLYAPPHAAGLPA